MIEVLHTKTFQTALLSALLFYALANPDTFKMVKRIPGLKFVMKTATNEITHSGVMTLALVFGVLLFLCVLLINKTLVNQLPFLNVVENFTEHYTDEEVLNNIKKLICKGTDSTATTTADEHDTVSVVEGTVPVVEGTVLPATVSTDSDDES